MFTVTEDDIWRVIPKRDFEQVPTSLEKHKVSVQAELGTVSLAAQKKPSEEILRQFIPRAIAKKYEKAISGNFELSQIAISGELSAMPLGIGVSGNVTLTYNRRKPSRTHSPPKTPEN